MEQENTPKLITVCDIQFRNNSKVYYFDPAGIEVKAGENVIIDTSRGVEFGLCVHGNHEISEKDIVPPLRSVIRIATEQDVKIDNENREKEKKAYEICLKKIEGFKLEMQLVSTEYAFDGSKILFFFTADGRVDFRELVKSLASVLRTRIELRQIGVRDKAKMVGGLGICGRPFCCREFLEDFQPVSIKMAKTQNLSLNPTKISGTCGRLMCCLNYEQEAYEDLHRTSPKPESFVDTPDGRGTVVGVNLLRQSVNVRLEKQPDSIVCHKNCDICVLRSGKAKKTDEPIPDDLAPISGGKQAKKQEQPAMTTYLNPVVMRRNAEPLAEARVGTEEEEPKNRRRKPKKPAEQEQQEQPAKEPKPAKKEQPKKEHPKKEQPKKQEPKKELVAEGEEAAEAPVKKHKNNYHRYYKRRKPGPKSEG